MAGYGAFAQYYDELNSSANYDMLCEQVVQLLKKHGVGSGIIADLGCGTGEMALRMADAGYDMIAVDASPDMLGVLQDKIYEQNRQKLLLLCQPLEDLDLYGTIHAAVATFDTFNHLTAGQFEKAIERTALFLEPGGALVFDVNTLYKHREILADTTITIESSNQSSVVCRWENQFWEKDGSVDIELVLMQDNVPFLTERFTEYYHSPDYIEKILNANGLYVVQAIDGESFGNYHSTSQRVLVVAKKMD